MGHVAKHKGIATVRHEDLAESFAPVANRDARVLILGSIPGRESLKAGQYYANPRNQFWKIMSALLGFAPDTPYANRLLALQSSGIALWDVLHSCERPGSLDASIKRESETPNNFALFFQQHPNIRAVFFNGAKAQSSYTKLVKSKVQCEAILECLPSTSPAHASKSLAQKLEVWKVVLAR
ncbi:MAG: DNA-deoxyinosine glycosylase [Rhodoferax sp.]|nr:DNA-deoxyinosine glycosylase [Rhodoferax sp.]